MKTCIKCCVEQPIESFHKKQSVCKSCSSLRRKAYYKIHKKRERELTDKWIANNRHKVRDSHLAKYGLNSESYDKMREEQEQRCAICFRHESEVPRSNYLGKVEHALHVDHCHATGKVRGLLCFNCNALLGKARDVVEVLERAAEYLRNAEERSKK